MKKRYLTFLALFIFVLFPFFAVAQETVEGYEESQDIEGYEDYGDYEELATAAQPETIQFEARVLEITEEREAEREDGTSYIQQNLKLKGLEDAWKDQEFEYIGIVDYEVFNQAVYKPGQRVVVAVSADYEGNDTFYVIDHVRRTPLYILTALFVVIIMAVGAWKGLRSLLGLVLSFVIIMGGMLPAILAGWNPVLVSIFGSFILLLVIIYLTEGLNQKSHIAIGSILISLLITGALSVLFTSITYLTGTSQEEVMYLVGIGQENINFKGLLLAAILIGTVGILDDVVISQISSVAEIKDANPDLDQKEVFVRAFRIGRSHLGSMVNTLFLAYAGAALPLLLLFSLNQPPFDSIRMVINNELIATEVVRTLLGSIGIALAMPISTVFAVKYLKTKKRNDPSNATLSKKRNFE